MGRGFVRQQKTRENVRADVKSGSDIASRHGYRRVDKKGASDTGGGREQMSPFFGSTMVLQQPRITQLSLDGRRSEKRNRESPMHTRSFALVLTAGIFRRQVFREIYGEVTAWIAMNSAHPPLSDLVIVPDLLAPQVLRA